MVTIIKFEMYFIMGIVSTMSVPLLLLTLGADGIYEGSLAKVKYDAFKKPVNTLANESKNIKSVAPTLHKKLMEFLQSERGKNFNLTETIGNLPETIIKDEKVQAQVTGIMYGKYTVAPKAFSAKVLLIALLFQVASKSITKSPDSFLAPIDKRYRPLCR